jgi:hypothetical protein
VIGPLDALVLGGEHLARRRLALALLARRRQLGGGHDPRVVVEHLGRQGGLGELERGRAVGCIEVVVEQQIEQRRRGRERARRGARRGRLDRGDDGGRRTHRLLDGARRRPLRAEPERVHAGLDAVGEDQRVDRAATGDAIGEHALEIGDVRRIGEQLHDRLAEHTLELVAQANAAAGQLELEVVETREPVEVLERRLLEAGEHDLDHAELHALERLARVFEPPRPLRPAQRLHQLVTRLLAELLEQLLHRQHLQRDERLAELAAELGRASDRDPVLLLGDDARRDEEVAERLLARRRRRADRVAVHEVDRLADATALQDELAGGEALVQIEQDRGERSRGQLPGARAHDPCSLSQVATTPRRGRPPGYRCAGRAASAAPRSTPAACP